MIDWRGHRAARLRRSPSGSASPPRFTPGEGALDRRELAHQHLPRAGAQGATDRDGRADRLAVGQRSEKLFAIIGDLSRSGVAVLYVSHRLDEVLRLCGRSPSSATAARSPSWSGQTLTRAGSGRGDRRRRHRAAAAGTADPEPAMLEVRDCRASPGCSVSASSCTAARCWGSGVWSARGAPNWRACIFGADRADGGRWCWTDSLCAPLSGRAVRRGLGLCPRSGARTGLSSPRASPSTSLANLDSIVFGPLPAA